ncbi:MAG: serine/threonine-protein kinase [Actinomycetota bacterium]
MTGDGGTPELPRHVIGDQAELGIDGLTEVSVIGSGGSSTVYQARQDDLDRTVAVKVVHAAWSMETRARFEHEREVTGRLSGHLAIVPIFATGITTRGEPYLLMPFYGRGSLFRLMQDRGPLPWREATFMLETLAQTLADSHREGIVHRDVKPGNVMLTSHLQPRLSDFGITQPTGVAISGGAIAYTPSYSPPEAFEAGTADPTVDVYGLGATLWAMLAGRAPFTDPGEPIDMDQVMVRARMGGLPPPPKDTPGPVAGLIERAMSLNPADRPADAGAFAAELRRAVRLSHPGPAAADRADRRRQDLLPVAALAGMITAGILLIAFGVGRLLFG